MFEYQIILSRQNELMARAEQHRLVREAKRVSRNREAGESRRHLRSRGSVRDALHLASR